MTDKKEISPQVQNILDNLVNSEQLVEINMKELNDYEREIVTDKLVSLLRTKYPKEYAKRFSDEFKVGQETLTKILEYTKIKFDWITNNQLLPHVKVHYSMLSNIDEISYKYLHLYISYKNQLGINASLAYIIDLEDDDQRLEIEIKDTIKNKEIFFKIA